MTDARWRRMGQRIGLNPRALRGIALLAVLSLRMPPAPARQVASQRGDGRHAPRASADSLHAVDSIFAGMTHATPGCVVRADRAGRPLIARAYGMASLEYDAPLDTASVLEAGSISKELTAAAVLLLARDGKLSLDDEVRRYVPELPAAAASVRIRHLLSHTSGIKDWEIIAALSTWREFDAVYSNARALDIVSRQRSLNNPPGAEFVYSNSNFTLAAIVVERVSGLTLQQFTRERLFAPLGMTRTQWRDDYARIVPHKASAYERGPENDYRLRLPLENAYGAGGLLTTVGDLTRWNEAMMNRTLGSGIADAMEKHPRLIDGREGPYGFGLFVGRFRGRREMLHDGSTAGYRALLAYYPDDSLSIALLCNAREVRPVALGRAVASLFLAARPQSSAPRSDSAVRLPAAALQAAAGLYRDVRTNDLLELTGRDGGWRAQRGSVAGATELRPLDAERFVLPSGDRGEFVRDGKQRVVAIRADTAVERPFLYERVAAWRAGTPLSNYSGDYVSEEVPGTVYSVRVDGAALRLMINPETAGPLTPEFADAFRMGYLGTIRFMRDDSGRVTGLMVSNPAARDVPFRRIERPAGSR